MSRERLRDRPKRRRSRSSERDDSKSRKRKRSWSRERKCNRSREREDSWGSDRTDKEDEKPRKRWRSSKRFRMRFQESPPSSPEREGKVIEVPMPTEEHDRPSRARTKEGLNTKRLYKSINDLDMGNPDGLSSVIL